MAKEVSKAAVNRAKVNRARVNRDKASKDRVKVAAKVNRASPAIHLCAAAPPVLLPRFWINLKAEAARVAVSLDKVSNRAAVRANRVRDKVSRARVSKAKVNRARRLRVSKDSRDKRHKVKDNKVKDNKLVNKVSRDNKVKDNKLVNKVNKVSRDNKVRNNKQAIRLCAVGQPVLPLLFWIRSEAAVLVVASRVKAKVKDKHLRDKHLKPKQRV